MIYQYVGMRGEIPESGFFVINVTLTTSFLNISISVPIYCCSGCFLL